MEDRVGQVWRSCYDGDEEDACVFVVVGSRVFTNDRVSPPVETVYWEGRVLWDGGADQTWVGKRYDFPEASLASGSDGYDNAYARVA